ncbi:MarR family transcriptional regulator [Sphingomonas sp. NPDC079357]|uniref:MarR family transcriptional regulator n=1 Tax=Sphingomonas sp. NPDC079357 TaxID=3364518 RepID=UPI00384A664D
MALAGPPTRRRHRRTLAAIQQRPGATQRELAELLEVSTVTCGRVIDRLESAGWAERRDDPQDRRAKRLHLHAAARTGARATGSAGHE